MPRCTEEANWLSVYAQCFRTDNNKSSNKRYICIDINTVDYYVDVCENVCRRIPLLWTRILLVLLYCFRLDWGGNLLLVCSGWNISNLLVRSLEASENLLHNCIFTLIFLFTNSASIRDFLFFSNESSQLYLS